MELPESVELGTSGERVALELVIELDGHVSEATVLESHGSIIDAAVRRAALALAFAPARVDDEPVRVRVAYEIVLGPRAVEQRETVAETIEELPPPAPPAGGAMGEIVVTGARVPEKRSESVISTQVISRDDLRRSGATTVGAALEAEPGIQVERTFAGTEIWIRGLDPEYTLILVDGQRLPGRVSGAIDLSRYSLENVERVEIVRGPSSALYGSDAIGGTVNIITRESSAPLEADAEARVATNNGSVANARVAGRPLKSLGGSLSAGHQHTGAYRASPNDVQTLGSARSLDTAGVALTIGTSRTKRLRLNLDYTRNRLDGTDLAAGGAIFDRTQLQEQVAAAGMFTQKSAEFFLSASAQYSQFREQYLNDQRLATALDSYQDNKEHQGLAATTAAYSWNDRQRTTVGGEVFSQILDSQRLSSTGFRARYSGFAEHRWVVAKRDTRELLTVVPGARLDLDSQFGNQLSPKLALRYDPLPELTLRASYGRGFRAPSFQELLLRFENPAVGYVVLGNPELGAESSHGVDVSAEWRPERKWFLSVAGFRNDLTNMISTVNVANPGIVGTLYSYDNIDRAWTMGLESQAIWSAHELLTLTLGYALMNTRDEALDRPLNGRPVHRFTFRTVSTHSPSGISLMTRGSLSLDRTYFLDQADGSSLAVTPEPVLQLDVRLSKTFTRHFELFVGGTNLANAGDAYAAILPRQFYAGLGGHY